MTTLRQLKEPTSMNASAMPKHRSDHLTVPTPATIRLNQAATSLDAEYAVLSEASAKSAALAAMLRASQPLLWLDNALVLQRDKPHAKRSSQRELPKMRGTDGHFTVVGDDGVWDDLVMESDLRRRRRIQWEVAKRIARVEREITRQPVAQRSWHVREKKRLLEEEKCRVEEAAEREKQRRQQERDERLRVEKANREKNRGRTNSTVAAPRASVVATAKDEADTKPEPQLKPKPNVDVDLDFEWPTKPAATAAAASHEPIQSTRGSDSDKENTQTQLQQGAREMLPAIPTVDTATDAADERLMEMVRQSLDDPSEPVAPCIVHHTKGFADDDADGSEGTAAEEKRYRNHNDPTLERATASRATSSLGRQVLSEHRTMATSVSFGAPAVAGSRLNSDVLRRLFSDLDTDRDGHLNRIETCMALHRLQIDVPAPRIVAFFKRINEVQTANVSVEPKRGQRGIARAKLHEPLKDVISYKHFVAFVTTAFEQQQQRQQQRTQTRDLSRSEFGVRERDDRAHRLSRAVPPLQVPSRLETFSLSPAKPIESPVSRPVGRPVAKVDDHERRLVEQREEEDVADRILRQIPDYLMARALAAAESPPRHVQQLVRQSLERIEKRSLEDGIVEDVTRDLVRQYAEKLLRAQQEGGSVGNDDDIDDVSGLRRAAAYFDSLGSGGQLDAGDLGTDGDGDGTVADWWKVLTEEQIAVLVQEIWIQRHASTAASGPTSNLEDMESPPISRSPSPEATLQETVPDRSRDSDTIPTIVAKVQRVAEKSIQTGSVEFGLSAPPSPRLPPPPPPPLSPPPEMLVDATSIPPSPHEASTTRTTLAQAILTDSNMHRQLQPSSRLNAHRVKQVLADLRRQRRRRQAAAPVSESVESLESAESVVITEPPTPPSKMPTSRNNQPHQVEQSGHDTIQMDLIAPITKLQEPAPSLDIAPTALPMRELQLLSGGSGPVALVTTVSSNRSSRASSSDVVSSYSSSLRSSMNLFREMSGDDVWRYAAQRRRARLGRRRQHNNRIQVSAASSSDRGSMDPDGDASEGEIVGVPAHDDLSDGELFGSTRRKVVRAKNLRAADPRQSMVSADGSNESQRISDSLESGEMLPSMIAMQRSYHQRLIHSSASSLESGEAEVGAVNT